MEKSLKITLKKSTIHSLRKQIATVNGLGLKKVNQSVILKDSPIVRGMINKVSHLVSVEDV